jgi:hypothetical protein
MPGNIVETLLKEWCKQGMSRLSLSLDMAGADGVLHLHSFRNGPLTSRRLAPRRLLREWGGSRSIQCVDQERIPW